ncbi:GumC family protein [Sphingomonas edaphi]|uniref:non-specific protein-tyrosine kinase n=1 Tax=Sphingomonas edaphi TaxID=2315689 RepID=A0A418PY42_9SPHN|nr:polysaccharide biosynthesis tyrosine autokinase [Sphingomonas edaphi]RIX27004.1 polysaccharide biosynthesis tyrosine autokinase [Sphingomonas edaphi]
MSDIRDLAGPAGPGSSIQAYAPGVPALAGNYFGEIPGEPEESLVRHYWRIFYRNRWIIGGITAACLVLALLVSMMMQRQYTATVRLQIAREAAKVVDVESVDSQESSGPNLEFYQTQYALLKSRSLSEAVVRDLRLADNTSFLTDLNDDRADDIQALSRDERFKLATEKVNANTKVAPLPGSSVVDVNYVAASPALAATIANSLADNFIETNLSRRYEATTYARKFLQDRINATRAKLEESERKAAEYAQAQGIIKVASEGGEGRVSSEQTLASADLTQLSAQLALARAARVQAEADYRANSGGAAAASSLTNSAVNQLRGQRAELTGELSKLQSDFGPEYPKVAALKSQIAELDRQIGREQGRVTSSVSQGLADKYRQALANEQGLQARVNGLKSAVLDQQQRSIQFNIIQRDVDTNRALYDALLQRFKEVGVAAGVGTNNVSIVDAALAPESPSQPNLPLNLAIGLLFGLLAGGGTALVREQLADAVILPAEFQQKLGIKLLGTTPKLSAAEVAEQLAQGRSDLSEAYFSILTAIQFSSGSRAPASMLFTSTQANEGKSTTALAIARSLASVGSRVLIIDGDMRNPSLHRNLKQPMAHGVSDVLSGKIQWNEAIQPIGSSGLSVMLAGRMPLNPAELLATDGFDKLMENVGHAFDHVIVDGPPVLGLADSILLARSCESAVFVIEAGRTRASQARMAINRLNAVRANILGAILTKLDAKEQGYGDNYGYQYAYAQQKEPKKLSEILKLR